MSLSVLMSSSSLLFKAEMTELKMVELKMTELKMMELLTNKMKALWVGLKWMWQK